MNNYSDARIGRLINQLRIHQNQRKNEVTLFLGAGCSLASSPRDISTWGIITDIVKKHLYPNTELPNNWPAMYQAFINIAWNNLGKKDKIHLLSPYFENLTPSSGYFAVKYLIENHFIHNIITTNFDPLVDQMLENLPHRKIIGEYEEMYGGPDPVITFIKAHGDLEYGGLRFSPYELQKLPIKLENEIRRLTHGIVLVVGYRGQDIGIMNSLNESDDHCSFWISPEKPEIYDGYSTEPIFRWMAKRNSDDNFIYGQFGDFDFLFPFLVERLSSSPDSQDIVLNQWKNSFLFDTMSMSIRISKVFSLLLRIENELTASYSWECKAPYFSESASELLKSMLLTCQDKILPKKSISSVGNGIEALILSFSLDVFVKTQGYPLAGNQFIDNIRNHYEMYPQVPTLSESFWDLSKRLLMEDHENIDDYFEIVITFDLDRDFSYVLKRGEFAQIYSLFRMIKIVSLFQKTSILRVTTQSNEFKAKKILEDSCQKVEASLSSTTIRLEDLGQFEHHLLHRYLFDMYQPLQQTLGNRHTYFIEKIYIEYEIVEIDGVKQSLYDEFLKISAANIQNYFGFIETNTFILTDTVSLLDDFVCSPNTGFLMTGPSGSGKSTTLRYWANQLQKKKEFLPIPFIGKEHRLMQKGVQVFSNWLEDEDNLEYINEMFLQREQCLVLIYDALNEVPGDFNFLLENYNELICFINKIFGCGYLNIKVVLSLRMDAFLHLKQNSACVPKAGPFYTSISAEGVANTIYQIPVFTKEQTLSLLEKSSLQKPEHIQQIYRHFGNILQNPFYIHLFGKILMDFADITEKNFSAVASKWYESLLESLGESENDQKDYCVLLNTLIIIKYRHGRKNIFITDLERELRNTDKLMIFRINKLKESGVLTYESISGQVDFSHDIYEELFLAKFLFQLDAPENFCSAILQQQREQIILNLAIRDYLQILRFSDSLDYLGTILNFLRQDIIALTRVVVQGLIWIQEMSPLDNFWITLFYQIDLKLGLECHSQVIKIILQEIDSRINERDAFNIQLLESLEPTLYTMENNTQIISNVDKAFFEYLFAKYLYLFSYLFEKTVYSNAKSHCEKALFLLTTDDMNLSVYDDTRFLYSVLLRYEGDLNQAVTILEKIFDNQLNHLISEKACQTGLELGAIYRELTRFNDALNLYSRMKKVLILTPYLSARLKMNTGIIYKNKLQTKVKNGTLSGEDKKTYLDTEETFKYVYQFAMMTNDVLLQLEIQAELIELCVIAEFFEITSLENAKGYLQEMEESLHKYPVPLRQIQYYRMKARIQLMEEKIFESLDSLRKGLDLSKEYNIPFRACDCCIKFIDIVLEYQPNNKDLLNEGMEYADYTINYYTSLHIQNHLYLRETLESRERLIKLLESTESPD